jgi:S-disulfanyl-L-cysteine oxidoreductase SoxD
VSQKIFLTFVSFAAGVFVSVLATGVAAQAPATTWDGVYTAEQSKRGAALYQTQCAACHGDALQGGGEAPALVGDTFSATWEGLSLADLFERIRTTMPQNAPASLSRPQYADILAFVLETGKFPAGTTALDPAALMPIKYRTYRP